MLTRLILLLGLVAALASQTARAENLLEILQLARQLDPTYQAARSTYLAEQQKLPQARALLLPSLSANADSTRYDNTTTSDPDGPAEIKSSTEYSSLGYSLTLTQPLFNGASFAALQQARTTVRKAEANFSSAQQDLYYRAAQAYFDVLRATDNLDLAVAEKTAVQLQLELANARLEVGLATITEVYEAKARYELTEAQHIEAINLRDDALEALRQLTGQSVTQVRGLRGNTPAPTPTPPDRDLWIQRSLGQNPAILASQASMEIARDEVRRLRAGHLPTLDLVGISSRSDSDGSSFGTTTSDEDIRRDSNSLGVQLNVPILQGGLVLAQTKEAAHRYDAAKQDYERQIRLLTRTTRAAYLGVSSGAKKIAALSQSVIAGESALQAKNEGFNAGINTNQDVLDAQRDLYRAKRDYADARYTHILHLLELKQAAGILSENDLSEINGWLQ